MNSTVQEKIELSAVLNLIPYLDTNFNYSGEVTLAKLVREQEKKFIDDNGELNPTFKILKTAIEKNPEFGKVVLVNQSSTNSTNNWKDDLIQGCTFRDPDGNYYVTYRGTGDGRWPDNADGMTALSTEMQEAAKDYFDAMAEKYFVEASAEGSLIFVTGHSKGGNEAQYVYMASEYEYLIDSCYSFDGQGFSGKARDHFMEKYGLSYEDKLSHMYSVCGENDFVHDLGYVIIPDDNTYFVETSGESFVSYHALEYMIGNDDGTYESIRWDVENGVIVHGEQGEVGQFAKRLSQEMMKLDDEDLHGVAVALMSLIDRDNEILGNISADWTDYFDLGAHGLPVLLKTLLFTEEGNAFLRQWISEKVEQINEKYGEFFVVAAVIVGACLVIKYAPIIYEVITTAVKIYSAAVKFFAFIDFVIDVVNGIDISEKIMKFVTEIKEALVNAINTIFEKIKASSAGVKYATANPQIVVDTFKLSNYAERLKRVNSRIDTLDGRMDSLYWRVGLRDLWNLMKADLLTKYSGRLEKAARYLEDTADEFITVEQGLFNSLQNN